MYLTIKPSIGLKPNICTTNIKSTAKLWPQKLSVRCFVVEEVERPLKLDLMTTSFYPLSSLGGAYGVTTLERPSVDMSQKSPSKSTSSPSLDCGIGGSDGAIGSGNGGGGGGTRDNDDYRFNDDENHDDEPCGIFRSRLLVPEVFDKETLNAILEEWMKTMKELPLGLQHACEIGALSSAKLTTFLWFNTRPTFMRLLTRLLLPKKLHMDFTAKIMADPSLPYKLLLEAVFSLGFPLWRWGLLDEDEDYCKRKRLWASVLTNAVTNALFVWSLAPKNNVFENSKPQRLVLSFFSKAVVFFALGFTAKASAQVISQEKIVSKEALAAGLSLGLISNLRYHLICGIDRRLQLQFDVPTVSLALCLALKFVNVAIGSSQSLSWEEVHSGVNNWFDFFCFGLLDTSTKSRRKRVLRKQKVRANI